MVCTTWTKQTRKKWRRWRKMLWLGCRNRVTLVCFAMVLVCALTAILLTGSGLLVTSYNMLLALVARDVPWNRGVGTVHWRNISARILIMLHLSCIRYGGIGVCCIHLHDRVCCLPSCQVRRFRFWVCVCVHLC
jgi:hypothetical protein